MSKNNLLCELLPSDKEFIQYLKIDLKTKQRRNTSLACTECRKKRFKCSGATLYTIYMTEGRQCLYDIAGDQRRKAYTAELLYFRIALCLIAKLRSGTLEEIL
ncbi:hypothetical protein N7481_008445 [Penicillium waksmanii]|uniref:uncharacterized protein n=1 Tax=Penicillium waksmanii TaxID=69791 RepID=UPI002547B2A4|nr:uncharacterized protein N7481_008445 [Penicillium waksmanii]KAJ5974738.1 hypothetical protein N7481_008445 [Penicillium waksmanii]